MEFGEISPGKESGVTEERNRDSRIELLRIIAMLLIIAHHLVTHTGVENLYEFGGAMPPAKMVFLQIFGMCD